MLPPIHSSIGAPFSDPARLADEPQTPPDRSSGRGLPLRAGPKHSWGMRAVIQRVSGARVEINGQEKDRIQSGLLVLLAVEEADDRHDLEWLSGKIVRLRIFGDAEGLMNRAVQDFGGEIMVISQFTLFASTKKGNRPSFIRSAGPDVAVPLYEEFLKQLESDLGRPVARGEFGADMKISLTNDGPVTIVIDTKNRE